MTHAGYLAVAAAVNARMIELGLSQSEVAERAETSRQTIRELQRAHARDHRPETLARVALALEWPPEALVRIQGGQTPDGDPGASAPTRQMNKLTARVESIQSELVEIERQLSRLRAEAEQQPRRP